MFPNNPRKKHTGKVRRRVSVNPADSAPLPACGLFSALLLLIMRETVMGIPPVPIVKKNANKEREIW